MLKLSRFLILAALLATPLGHADAQVANGKVTTAAPTYLNNAISPMSLDTAGNLRTATTSASAVTANGQATTAAPSYVNATPNPLSLNLTGDLRTIDKATVAQGAALASALGPMMQGVATTAAPSYSNNTINPLSLDLAGNQRASITTALPAGNNNIGDVDIVTLPALPTGTNQIGNLSAPVDTGLLNHSIIAGATTNSTLVKGSAGTIYDITVGNYGVATNYGWLKIYDQAGAPTCGTGTPVVRILISPQGTSATGFGNGGINVTFPWGKRFTAGIAYCITAAIADADTTATTAAIMAVNITYK